MFFGVEQLAKAYDGKSVFQDVAFVVEQGEVVSLVGPSGVGKTTLLKIIAGLERADQGRLVFQRQPSRLRPVLLVFQDYVLFPNLTVFENVAFGLRVRRMPASELLEKVREILEYFQLWELRGRFPNQLSAGQRQRVAIARAMVVNPMLLLLDEPFANLDRNLKMSTAEFIRNTQKAFGVTTISVTHDLEEAFVMSDRIGLMLEGGLVQFDRPDKVYSRPASRAVAEFLGPLNEIPPDVRALLGVPCTIHEGERSVFARPEAIALELDPQGPGLVREAVFAGHHVRYLVEVGTTLLTVYGPNNELHNGFQRGQRVRPRILHCIEPQGGDTA